VVGKSYLQWPGKIVINKDDFFTTSNISYLRRIFMGHCKQAILICIGGAVVQHLAAPSCYERPDSRRPCASVGWCGRAWQQWWLRAWRDGAVAVVEQDACGWDEQMGSQCSIGLC
jgi:hypothetical protein